MSKLSMIAKRITVLMGMVGIVYASEPAGDSFTNKWTGLYVGVDAGLAVKDIDIRSQHLGFTNPSGHCNTSSNDTTLFPGVHLGYLRQFSNRLVAGIEGNVALNFDSKDSLNCKSSINAGVSDHFSFKNQIQTSMKGRLGQAWEWHKKQLFPYLTLGVSFAGVELKYKNEGGDHYSKSTTQSGWLIGTGIEWAFKKNWSLRAEYHYIDYGKTVLLIPSVYGLADPNGNARADLNSHNFVVSINSWL